MAEGLSLETVKQFIIERGGKVTNHELVKHFKSFLNDSERQKETRALFKEYVNTVSVIKQENGIKYLALKEEFYSDIKTIVTEPSESANIVASLDTNDSLELSNKEEDLLSTNQLIVETPVSPIVHSHSSPSILQAFESQLPLQDCHEGNSQCFSEPQTTPIKGYVEPPKGETPLPPPRRKGSAKGKENRNAKIQERMQLLCEAKEIEESPTKTEIPDITLSPGSVKERAKSLNKMASECDLTQKVNNIANSSHSSKKREGRMGSYDDDSSSMSALDGQKKEWMTRAAKADYLGLIKLLKEEPKLAHFKDFISGFTALHWAAKHGNADIVKLIAGTHQANPNARSHGGYTPLHLAAMFCHEEIMEILIHSYGGDPNLRDYSGKKPHQYLPAPVSQQYAATINYNIRSNARTTDVNFMRMGSLNAKVQKTAAVLGGSGKSNRLTRLKSWGSADNLSDLLGARMMPPPKSAPPKKKKPKKVPTTDRESVVSLKGKGVEADESENVSIV